MMPRAAGRLLLLAALAPAAVALGFSPARCRTTARWRNKSWSSCARHAWRPPFACGGLLALAGALMQTLFRNPLAEPYLLGASGGAGLAALLGMAAGLAWPWVSALAFAGSLLALSLAAALGGRMLARDHTPLLLAGVMLAAGFAR